MSGDQQNTTFLDHDDFIHDVQFDYYGNKIASCSSDQKIKIWHRVNIIDQSNQNNQDGFFGILGKGNIIDYSQNQNIDQLSKNENYNQSKWELKETLAGSQAHTGAVWRVAWADPEFGGGQNAILASCGYDKQIIIWSESESLSFQKQHQKLIQQQIQSINKNHKSEKTNLQNLQKLWQKQTFWFLKEAAQDIKFGPKHHGLVLAVAVSNGTILVYKWQDPTNLSSHQEFREINIISGYGECTTLSWNPAFDEPISMVVGCMITSSQNQFEEIKQKQASSSQSKNADQDQQLQDEYVQNIDCQLLKLVTFNSETQQQLQRHIAINGNPNLKPMNSQNFMSSSLQHQQMMHKSMINDVQWAPLAGRSFHMIASCSKDRKVIIWRAVLYDIFNDVLLQKPEVSAIQMIDFNGICECQIQRIKWNILGTCFATSGEDGDVRVWQRSENMSTKYLSSINLFYNKNEEFKRKKSNKINNISQMNKDIGQSNEETSQNAEHFKQILHFESK